MQVTEIVAAVRSGSASALEVLDDHLARIEALNPELNAIVIEDYERARTTAAEPPARPPPGRAIHRQGGDRDGRPAGLRGFAPQTRRDTCRGCARGRPAAAGGRDPARQDEHLRAVRASRLVEPRLRGYPKPGRPVTVGLRVERRRGRSGRRVGCRPSASAPTTAARSAPPPTSAGSPACVRGSAASRPPATCPTSSHPRAPTGRRSALSRDRPPISSS